MKTVKLLIVLLFGAFLQAGTVRAQTAYEALRNSFFIAQGSARTVGVGGAIGAFGADFTTIYSNPAGVAAFRRSDFTITPEWSNVSTFSQLQNANDLPNNPYLGSRNNRLSLSNVGFVTVSLPRAKDWRTVNFGMGLVRLANFNQNMFFEGVSEGSITGRFAELADGLTPDELDDFEAGLAYETGAIYNSTDDHTVYLTDFTQGELVKKSQSVQSRGGITELSFSLAANYREKLMVGAAVGIPFLRYTENKYYREVDELNENKFFNELIYEESLTTLGTGINAKLGLIFLPVHKVRLGITVHTPTFFKLNDSYRSDMTYDFTQNGVDYRYDSQSPDGYFEYKLRTPWRFIASGGFLIDKRAFLSAEAEWVNYSSSFYVFETTNAADLSYEQEINRQILNDYTSALSLRAGGELRLGAFRLRGGYSHAFSPYARFNTPRSSLHGGVGLRTKKFYLDLAYVRATFSEAYFPYETALYPTAEVDTDVKRQDYLMTLGFKF